MTYNLLAWIILLSSIGILLALDLGILSKHSKEISFKNSVYLSLFYFLVASLFGTFIYYYLGDQKAKEYFTGFIIEKAMALDNIFIISMVFDFFKIPNIYQHRVLLFGIFGVLIFRAMMIGLGSYLLIKFSWILYLFAGILILTGIKIFYMIEVRFDVKQLSFYKLLQKYINITPQITDNSFIKKIDNKLYATPLLISLIIIELMDLIFAIDSIPAIFAITSDPYIVYSSNIFAILGLRALFFCLANIVSRFKYIKYSLAAILIFIGGKIIMTHYVTVSITASLTITMILISLGIVVSIVKKDKTISETI